MKMRNRIFELLARKEKIQPTASFFEKPEITDIFNKVEADIVQAIKALPFDDYKGRDALFHELRCLEAVKRKVGSLFNELKSINHNIEVENKNGK